MKKILLVYAAEYAQRFSHPQPLTYISLASNLHSSTELQRGSSSLHKQMVFGLRTTVLYFQNPAVIQLQISNPSPTTHLIWERYGSLPNTSEAINCFCDTGKTDNRNERTWELPNSQQATELDAIWTTQFLPVCFFFCLTGEPQHLPLYPPRLPRARRLGTFPSCFKTVASAAGSQGDLWELSA